MIKDNIQRANTYYNLSKNIKTAFEWIINNDTESMSDGKYEISDMIYANIQSYQTKDDAPYEAHRSYIDIQYMINGEEEAGVTDYKNCSTTDEYNPEKDCEFLQCNTEENFYRINKGEFFVFFPHDAHKPALKIRENKSVKKVVVKVHV